jgi:capsular polysaccharide transport system permease protein
MGQLPAEATGYRSTDLIGPVDSRAALISKALRSVARRARTPRNIWVPTQSDPHRRWQHVFVWAVLAGFGLVVLLPNLAAGLYLAFAASNQYATEARFAVRGGEPSLFDQFGGLVGIPSTQRVQDSLILSDYVRGIGMVNAVDKALNLRRLFTGDGVDFLSRLNPKHSDEELLSYWRRHVEVNIDSASGIITIVVRAFTPQDSFDIANKIVSLSETLVNDLTERSRRDALRQAQSELTRANQNLQEKTTAMRDLRNAEGILDSDKSSEAMTKLMGDLRLELIHMEQEYSAQRQTISADAPQLRVLEARIDSMKDQIRGLDAQMTGIGNGAGSSLSTAIGRFDRERLEESIAEKQYIAAAAAFEVARIQLESQNIYLATFLKPVIAQEALYPKRLWLWSIVLVISLLLWGSGVGAAVVVRNHMAA